MDLTFSLEEYFRWRPMDNALAVDRLDSSDDFGTPEISFLGTGLMKPRRNPLNGTEISNNEIQNSQGYQNSQNLHGFSRNMGQTSTSRSLLDYAPHLRQKSGEHLGKSGAYLLLQESYWNLECEYAFTQGELQASK